MRAGTVSGVTSVAPGMTSAPPPSSRESSITVAVRVRPFTESEQCNLIKSETDSFFLGDGSLSSYETTPTKKSPSPRGIRKIINVVDERMLIFDPPETNPLTRMQREAFPNHKTSRIREHRFVFDRLFDVHATQEDVYNGTTRPLLDSVLDGFNATVFAYGATGCGKTHTISGNPANPGVIFLTMKELYQKISELSDTKLIDVSLSFLEIYNETIRDLLNPKTSHKRLVLREDSNQKISVANLSCHKPESVEEVMELILLGNQNRTSSPTEANLTSSRSHAVLQINVIQKDRTVDLHQEHTFATLSIIDLAGSERAAATKNRGARLNEGANINKSLLALGNCINALCDPVRRNHVPYRDSKLTRLLKFSLGGNCKTVMIVCVSPSSQHYDETLNTLKYANRAKEIKTKIIRNQHNLDRHVGSYLKMITEQKHQIEELRGREAKAVEAALESYNRKRTSCASSLFSSIDSIRQSLSNLSQEKWKRYFILAKRKILLLQRIDCETLLNGFDSILQKDKNNKTIRSMMDLCEQLLVKIDTHVEALESQYSKPCELDYVVNESASQILKRLREEDGWADSDTAVYEQLLSSVRESLERDILFNSSVLFDHLIHELRDYNFLPREFISILAAFSGNVEERKGHFDLVTKNVTSRLDSLINGDFDTAIESCTSAFMREKLQDLKEISSPESNKKYKRGPISPLRSSPPRNFKKIITRKPLTPKVSPVKKYKKSVRWDVPKSDSTMLESDASMDESMHNTFKSDDESPLANQKILEDELDLQFDPNLDSPVALITPQKQFTNPRLSINLESQDTLAPLLNKQASSKSMIPQPSITPTGVISKYGRENNARNIQSNGSDKVD